MCVSYTEKCQINSNDNDIYDFVQKLFISIDNAGTTKCNILSWVFLKCLLFCENKRKFIGGVFFSRANYP